MAAFTFSMAGDDALGLDGHRDHAQRYPVQDVDERDDESQARLPNPDHPAEAEQHALLVLLDDVHRHGQQQDAQEE
jgi:hypothetical protein